MMALFRMRVQVGVSELGRCFFITGTYQKDSERLQDATCVRKDWAALWLRMKRLGRKWEWLRVMELTKKGTPHFHAVMGPETGTIRCHGNRLDKGSPEMARFRRRMRDCSCMSHLFSREWLGLTGDSFMWFAVPVTNAATAGSYLSKYFAKDFDNERRKELGMSRRWSTSRGWPGNGRVRLVVPEGGWSHIRKWPRSRFLDYGGNLNPHEGDLLERTGGERMLALTKRSAERAKVTEVKRRLRQ